MAEFLETIESIRAEEASVQRLFTKGDGTGVRHRGRRTDPAYMAKLAEAANFIAEVVEGRRPAYHLQEAMTTSDFTNLFGDVIDRQVLGTYRETPQTFRSYLKVGTVRDFRTVKRFYVNGGEGVLSKVREQTEYPEAALADGAYSYSVEKYGRRMPFSWETQINDDLEMLTDVPQRYGKAARRTEERFATGLFTGVSGPNGTFFANGNKNVINTTNGAASDNPALSVTGLQDGFKVLSKQVDADGEPIAVDVVHLVVPPALMVQAMQIVNATEIWDTSAGGGGGTGRELHVANWMKNIVQVHINPYIPLIATSANGSTSWFMFADPSTSRPAAEVGFLRGHEEPEVFMKQPNSMRVGGGAVDPSDGDFETDTVEYKVRHVMGGTLMDPKAAVASNGSGA
jgi:hypothetical protein